MNDQSIQLSALIDIRSKAEAEVRKAQRSVERAQAQLETAKTKVKVLQDTIDALTGGATDAKPKSQKEQVRDVIRNAGHSGITVPSILLRLKELGVTITANNPTASIHVAADRLAKEGVVEALPGDDGKIYKWCEKPTGQGGEEPPDSDEDEDEEETETEDEEGEEPNY
jgi:hypothetical protein